MSSTLKSKLLEHIDECDEEDVDPVAIMADLMRVAAEVAHRIGYPIEEFGTTALECHAVASGQVLIVEVAPVGATNIRRKALH